MNQDNFLLLTGYQSILRDNEDYVFIKDTHSIYRAASDALAKMAGYAHGEEIVGKSDYDLFEKTMADAFLSDDQAVLSGKSIHDKIEHLLTAHGAERWGLTQKRAIYNEQGEVIGLYGVSHDVSELQRLRQTAAEAKKSVDLVSHLPGGVGILHEKNGEFILDYANDGWFGLHEINPSEEASWLGKSVSAMIDPRDRVGVTTATEAVRDDPSATGNAMFRLNLPNGHQHWIRILFRFAYEENGIRYYYTNYANTDQFMKIQEDLRESQITLKEAISGSDTQYFIYYPSEHKCVLSGLNKRYGDIPLSYENFPSSFLLYVQASPSDSAAFLELIRKIDNGAKEASCTIKMRLKGVYFYETIHLSAIALNPNSAPRALGYMVDVTERMESEERIRHERLRLKTLEGNVFEAFSFNLSKNSDPEIQTSDTPMLSLPISEEFAAEALRVSPSLANSNPATQEILLRAANRIPDKKERDRFLLTFSSSSLRKNPNQSGFSNEFIYRRRIKDLIHYVTTNVEILPDPDSGDLFAFFYTRDVNAEQISKKLNAKIIHRNYASVSLYDLSLNRFFFHEGDDPTIKSLDGLDYETALEKATGSVLPEDVADFASKLRKETILSALENAPTYVVYNARKDVVESMPGQPHRVMENECFYLDEGKDLVVFLVSDVTPIFEKERANREALKSALLSAEQASMAKTEFLSRMSHEIRTPMNAIIGLDAIALNEKNLSPELQDHLNKISVSAHFLLSLINDILDMSRIESGRMSLKNESFPFRELIDGINTILTQQCLDSGLHYECSLKTPLHERYIGDVTKLQQILVNLLGNAVKFTPRGGAVYFAISSLDEHEGHSTLYFEVRDTGIGMDPSFLPYLFHPFSQENPGRTSNYGGTGLGLAISKNLANLMGGDIEVHSRKGEGSTFAVRLPLAVDESDGQLLDNEHFDALTSLYVGAPSPTRAVLEKWLAHRHYSLRSVDDPQAAEVLLQDSPNSFDLLLYEQTAKEQDAPFLKKARSLLDEKALILLVDQSPERAADVALLCDEHIPQNCDEDSFFRIVREARIRRQFARGKAPMLFDFTGHRILLAEDNTINAEIAKSLLESKGAQVAVAKTGLEAVEAFKAAPVGYYELILMDVRMPIMDGLEATRTIRALAKKDAASVPILAMTANAFQEDVNQSLAAGMNAHLAKPIEPQVLFEAVAKYLGQK